MSLTIITSPEYSPLSKNTNKTIFLAGPIQGTDDWQNNAIELLNTKYRSVNTFDEYYPNVLVANPRRKISFGDDYKSYIEQVDWEHLHLDMAGFNGVILFWLANETQHDCTRSYAQTTRFELGHSISLWLHNKEEYFNDSTIVIGIDSNFSGAKYIRYTIQKFYPKFKIVDSLEQACNYAMEFSLGLTNEP